jgi:hypothetical protein
MMPFELERGRESRDYRDDPAYRALFPERRWLVVPPPQTDPTIEIVIVPKKEKRSDCSTYR